MSDGKVRKQPRRKADREEIDRRIDEVEQAMARGMGSRAVMVHFAKKWGITTRQIRNYQFTVRKRWRKQAEDLGPDERIARRDEYRTSLQAVYAMAMNKQAVVRDMTGAPLLDEDGKPLLRPAPEIKSAINAMRALIALDGVAEPVRQVIETPDVGPALAARSAEELVSFLQSGRMPAAAAKASE